MAWRALRAEASLAGLAAGAACGEPFWWVRPRGLGYILVQPTLVSLSMDVDPAQTGLCTGLIGFGVFVGGGVGSTLGGFAISAGGYEALWIAAAAALALQTVIGWQALPQT